MLQKSPKSRPFVVHVDRLKPYYGELPEGMWPPAANGIPTVSTAHAITAGPPVSDVPAVTATPVVSAGPGDTARHWQQAGRAMRRMLQLCIRSYYDMSTNERKVNRQRALRHRGEAARPGESEEQRRQRVTADRRARAGNYVFTPRYCRLCAKRSNCI